MIIELLNGKTSSEGNLHNRSLSSHVYDFVVKSIFDKKYPLGKRLTEIEIAKQLDISTVPVRDAMQKLYQDGWIERVPYKGSYVRNLHDRKILQDLFTFRQVLEIGAAYIVAEKITPEQLAQLKKALDQFAMIDDEAKPYDRITAEVVFHRLIVSFTGCERMISAFESNILQVHCISGYYYDGPKPSEYLVKNHKVIYDVLAEHNVQRAAQLIKQHIEMGQKYLFKGAQL